MDVHPTKNGMYRYWSIATSCGMAQAPEPHAMPWWRTLSSRQDPNEVRHAATGDDSYQAMNEKCVASGFVLIVWSFASLILKVRVELQAFLLVDLSQESVWISTLLLKDWLRGVWTFYTKTSRSSEVRERSKHLQTFKALMSNRCWSNIETLITSLSVLNIFSQQN